MWCLLLLVVACLVTPGPSFAGLRPVFSAIGGLSTCFEPCVGDVIFAMRELLFFEDTINNFENLCLTYENASLCVIAKEEKCARRNSFAAAANASDNVRRNCDEQHRLVVAQLPCVKKNLTDLLNDCDSQCWITRAANDIGNKDIDIDSLSAHGALGVVNLNEICLTTSCFASCVSNRLNVACLSAGTEIISAILRPFSVNALLLAGSDPVLSGFLQEPIPDSCKAFLNVADLSKMSQGTFQVDADALSKLQSSLETTIKEYDYDTANDPPTTTPSSNTSSASSPILCYGESVLLTWRHNASSLFFIAFSPFLSIRILPYPTSKRASTVSSLDVLVSDHPMVFS